MSCSSFDSSYFRGFFYEKNDKVTIFGDFHRNIQTLKKIIFSRLFGIGPFLHFSIIVFFFFNATSINLIKVKTQKVGVWG